jgi:hypothetical protein
MGWEGFMQTERSQLRQGKLRRALGVPLPGESVKQLDTIGERDCIRAEQGLLALMDDGGFISYKHVDDLGRLDMKYTTAAERVTVGWLRERVQRRGEGAEAPTIPYHLR